MADCAELRMSVVSIKRVDPYIKDILATSTHVALYKFNPAINEWEKSDTEGALFLYSRTGEPWHSIMIMNRLNTDNLIEPLVKEFEFQLQPPFVLYRNSNNKIFGIWFYNRDECINITRLLEALIKDLKGARQLSMELSDNKSSSAALATAPAAPGAVDIFSMLTKAQEDFNNKSTPSKAEATQVQPKFSSTPRAPDVTSQSVMDFFAKACTTGKVSKRLSPPPDANGTDNFLHKLMSNPAHTVEHIEKQQRSITPQDSTATSHVNTCGVVRLGKRILPQPDTDSTVNPLPLFFDSLKSSGQTFESRKNSTSLIDTADELTFARGLPSTMQQVNNSPISNILLHSNSLNTEEREAHVVSPLANFLDASSSSSKQPQLLPPMMFETSLREKKDQSLLLSADAFDKDVPLLTSKQMQQALIYLLKNDSDFVTKLHEAYTKCVNEKLNFTNSNSVK